MPEVTIEVEDYTVVPITFATSQISPPTGLTATPVGSGGTFAAGTYYWEVTATTALGETTVSNEANATLVLNGSANLAWTLPNGVITHIKVYRGTAPGTENTLVATLGPTATAFTDTNVGAGGTPPSSNTATIQDTVLITGACEVVGYSFAETTGTGTAYAELQDSSTTMFEIRLPAGASETLPTKDMKYPVFGRINMHVNSGAIKGVVMVAIPC